MPRDFVLMIIAVIALAGAMCWRKRKPHPAVLSPQKVITPLAGDPAAMTHEHEESTVSPYMSYGTEPVWFGMMNQFYGCE